MKKEKLYIVRGLGGEYASGTKISTTKSGAKNSLNNYCDKILERRCEHESIENGDTMMPTIFRAWDSWVSRKDFTDFEFARASLNTIGTALGITRKDYDKYMQIVDEIWSYWYVEEVEQEVIE